MISRSRKGIYSIYVSHAAGTKPLTRPSRKAEGIHAIISNWLDQFVTTAPAASEPTVVTLEPLSSATSTSAGLWVASTLQSHIELSELSAIEVDGVIIITAEHEETGYGIERCYTSWELARQDLLDWINRLSTMNITATASSSGLQRGRVRQPVSYDDIKRRPTHVGRVGGPGRNKDAGASHKSNAMKPASMERQMLDILSKKCSRLTADLAAAEGDCRKLERRCERCEM